MKYILDETMFFALAGKDQQRHARIFSAWMQKINDGHIVKVSFVSYFEVMRTLSPEQDLAAWFKAFGVALFEMDIMLTRGLDIWRALPNSGRQINSGHI